MVALVSTKEDAEHIVRSTKFPPLGNRGLDAAGLDSDFFLQGDEGFAERANRETFLVAQIETIEAVNNADSIAAVEGIDVLFIGWGDLSLRVKHAPGVDWTLDEVVERGAAAAAAHGKTWGAVTFDPAEMKKRNDQGARLLACTGEFIALKNSLAEKSEEIRSTFPGRS